MVGYLAELLSTLSQCNQLTEQMVKWGSPIPFFGKISESRLATVGINPSVREYNDFDFQELKGHHRRLETLDSLGLDSWLSANQAHLNRINYACETYFQNRPYDRWFGRLEKIISKTGCSFYNFDSPACHIDLVPYATFKPWGGIEKEIQVQMLKTFGPSIGALIRDSSIKAIIANGRTVMNAINAIIDGEIRTESIQEWALPRKQGEAVPGISYFGYTSCIAGVELDRFVLVLGYNHNIQSSFGVTNEVIESISDWIGQMFRRVQL